MVHLSDVRLYKKMPSLYTSQTECQRQEMWILMKRSIKGIYIFDGIKLCDISSNLRFHQHVILAIRLSHHVLTSVFRRSDIDVSFIIFGERCLVGEVKIAGYLLY
jgi:hypothetical protein